LLTAYLALGTMAVVPIYFGSYSSLKKIKASSNPQAEKRPEDDHESSDEEEEEAESLSTEDAYMFPLIGSGVLFSLYLVFRYLNKEYVNYLLTAYFAVIGVAALTKMGEAVIRGITGIKERACQSQRFRANADHAHVPVLFDVRFTRLHMVSAVASLGCTIYYAWTKNWVASNLFGLAFATSAVQLIALDSFKTGIILLSGLFFYDIFWVFGTEVMVSVARNFDAPIKVVFPKVLFVAAGEKLQFTMLGLGDIVIPGIFVALCLRYDQYLALRSKTPPTHKRPFDFPKPYFYGCFIAYVLGLATTVFVMHTFKAAQPALLYLSPACTLSSVIVAVTRGELGQLFKYSAEDKDEKKSKETK
ncbi:peptidase A22B, signal peptide peptidase, partial [Thamnocephalis sphaerospora]